MPESANPVQRPQTIIEIRPFKGGWQCFEGPGVGAVLDRRHGKRGRNQLRHCAREIGRGEIRVLNADGSIKDVIRLDGSTRNYD
jgi:hypothetical protein